MSAIVETNQYVDYFDNPHSIIQGAIGSALAAGSVVGSLAAGPISNWMGRRNSIWVACFWWILGTAVQGTFTLTSSDTYFALLSMTMVAINDYYPLSIRSTEVYGCGIITD
jgi:MFS family permease